MLNLGLNPSSVSSADTLSRASTSVASFTFEIDSTKMYLVLYLYRRTKYGLSSNNSVPVASVYNAFLFVYKVFKTEYVIPCSCRVFRDEVGIFSYCILWFNVWLIIGLCGDVVYAQLMFLWSCASHSCTGSLHSALGC